MYAAIGILFLTNCVSSQNLNCTRLTTACPTAAQWSDRGNYFNCTKHKDYVCLMASNAELREGCVFDSIILAGQTGCPYTKQCDDRTNQPLLVTENNYLPCPPDLKGCPQRNHSGYSILEIYKYPRCQGKKITDKRSVSPYKTTDPVTAIPPARIIVICIMLGVITVFVTAIIIICRDKTKVQGHQKSGDVVKGKSNSSESNDIFYTKDGNERCIMHSSEGPSKGLNTEYMGYKEGVDFLTKAVNSLHGNDVLSEHRENNSRKERPEIHLSARQQSYQINQDILQISTADITIENEEQDIIEEMVDLTSSRKKDLLEVLHSRSPSCSSSGSDRSQTPMLKVISKTLPLSPQTLPKQVQSLHF